MLDAAARRFLGISGDEFLRRWKSGYYLGDLDGPGVQEVYALLPFAGESAQLPSRTKAEDAAAE